MSIFPTLTYCHAYITPLWGSFYRQQAKGINGINIKLLKVGPMLTEVSPPGLCLHFCRICGKQEEVKFVGWGNFIAIPNKEATSTVHLSIFELWIPLLAELRKPPDVKVSWAWLSHATLTCLLLPPQTWATQRPTSLLVHITVVTCLHFPSGHTLRRTLSSTDKY